MALQVFDFRGLKCPQPSLKLTTIAIKIQKGDVVEIMGDCSTFEKDMRVWCTISKKTLLWMKDKGEGAKSCQIQF